MSPSSSFIVSVFTFISVFSGFASAMPSESMYMQSPPTAAIKATILSAVSGLAFVKAIIETTNAVMQAQNLRLDNFLTKSSLVIVLPLSAD